MPNREDFIAALKETKTTLCGNTTALEMVHPLLAHNHEIMFETTDTNTYRITIVDKENNVTASLDVHSNIKKLDNLFSATLCFKSEDADQFVSLALFYLLDQDNRLHPNMNWLAVRDVNDYTDAAELILAHNKILLEGVNGIKLAGAGARGTGGNGGGTGN